MTEATERAIVLNRLRSRRKATRSAAVAELCEMFEPLVRSQARTHLHSNAELDDLEQVARLGLVEACSSFVAQAKEKGWNDGAFPTYAMWCIRNALTKYDENSAHLVKLPAWMNRRMPKLRRVRRQLEQELMRDVTHAELAVAMKMPVSAIDDMVIYEEAPYPLPGFVTGVMPGSNDEHRKRLDRLHRKEKR